MAHPLYIPTPYQDAIDRGRVILRDGSTATIRLAAHEDGQALQEFFARLSPESRRHRFFSLAEPPAELVRSFCDCSKPEHLLTLVVTRRTSNRDTIVGAATYIARDAQSAEVAFSVDDQLQGRGLGTQLLERLALLAIRHGFTRFWAVTEADNRSMIEVFRRSGFPLRETADSGLVEVDFAVAPTASSVQVSEVRDRVFTAASLRPFFRPNAVAVVGASRDPQGIGHRILDALLRNRFQGPVYPVNPNAQVVGSIRACPSAATLPEQVDLAIIAVPRDVVLDAVDDCAKRGVRALVVITAGFSETGEEGRSLQQRVLERVRGYGMRMVGPNCMGLLNTDPAVQLNASFSPVFPPAGRLALSSQSGALGLAILALAQERDLGLSTFVSVGNKADVSGNDLIQYWEVDDNTDVILLYLESFGNPRRFARIARRVSRTKPIVAVKSGRTSAGRRAAGSHTAAMASSDVAVDALFRQTGVIRADTLDEMFDIAATLGSQPLPDGRRIGIVTNAGGPGILCTDVCEGSGLTIPEPSDATKRILRQFLPPTASVSNPIDMIASAGADSYRRTIEAMLASNEFDALIIIYIPVDRDNSPAVAAAIRDGVRTARANSGAGKPVLACMMTAEARRSTLRTEHERIPVYSFPESAATVLSKITSYSEWRRQPLGIVPAFDDVDEEGARGIVGTAQEARDGGWLTADETRSLLEAFRIPQARGGVARTAGEAAEIAEHIGFPVAAKLASHTILHKTEGNLVRLDLGDAAAVRAAFDGIRNALAARDQLGEMDGVLVQSMIKGAVELMAGITDDPLFGPLIGFGLGGIHVEILGDVRFRVTPLTDRDAAEMVREIRGYRLLEGYRGHPAADVAAIEEVLLRISFMVERLLQITELDLNPILALAPGEGCRVVDARIRIHSR
ncbi:MAG TPA: GNAT family N-acetyltransferase [Gemmatimonadaceae bacterium]|nr:GNAT family N-acetyltransferase [Gemmatimonadaceae bacterium]